MAGADRADIIPIFLRQKACQNRKQKQHCGVFHYGSSDAPKGSSDVNIARVPKLYVTRELVGNRPSCEPVVFEQRCRLCDWNLA
jgi:hypothetical protein